MDNSSFIWWCRKEKHKILTVGE